MISARALSLTLIGLGLGAGSAFAQPGTDIYIGSLTISDGRAWIGPLRNITDRPGYDNQPSFAPDGQSVFYTSIREDGQADIYRYDLAGGRTARLTHTAESEYSPSVMPGGSSFSVVRVEADSAQRFWRFDLDGGSPVVLLEDVKPVGYYGWYDANTVALFVLGSPPTLQVADVSTGTAEIRAEGIGRSLHRVPSSRSLSFVHKQSENEWWIALIDPESGAIEPLVRTPSGSEDFAWTPDGAILMGRDSKLFEWRPGSEDWQEVADLVSAGVVGITRIAVSPAGDRVAIVGSRGDEGGQ
jgi:dipeptidyl aminopeptidase/acylaminoacyl peptidase